MGKCAAHHRGGSSLPEDTGTVCRIRYEDKDLLNELAEKWHMTKVDVLHKIIALFKEREVNQ